MKKETRTVVYDDELRMEAYRFEGICHRGRGSIVLFNPGDSHACVQSDEGTFDYRGFNILKEIMLDLAEEGTGKRELPGFSKNVICRSTI